MTRASVSAYAKNNADSGIQCDMPYYGGGTKTKNASFFQRRQFLAHENKIMIKVLSNERKKEHTHPKYNLEM